MKVTRLGATLWLRSTRWTSPEDVQSCVVEPRAVDVFSLRVMNGLPVAKADVGPVDVIDAGSDMHRF